MNISDSTNIYLGNNTVNKICLGNNILWESGGNIDEDVVNFITVTGIVDEDIISALDIFVKDIKANGIWNLCDVIYPFVGGTSFTHKFNLKDPQDTDNAYRLTFFGGLTHDLLGITPNGTNGWARTHWNPAVRCVAPNYAAHIGSYISVSANTTAYDWGNRGPGGAGSLNTSLNHLYVTNANVNLRSIATGVNQVAENRYNYTEFPIGFHLSVRDSIGQVKFYYNGVLDIPDFIGSTVVSVPYSEPIAIFAVARGGLGIVPSSRRSSFFTIGQALNATQTTSYYNSIQNLQIALGREV